MKIHFWTLKGRRKTNQDSHTIFNNINGNDKSKGGITVAIKSGNTENKSFQNIGTKNHYDNMDLSTDGDDILTFIKTNAKTLSKK